MIIILGIITYLLGLFSISNESIVLSGLSKQITFLMYYLIKRGLGDKTKYMVKINRDGEQDTKILTFKTGHNTSTKP